MTERLVKVPPNFDIKKSRSCVAIAWAAEAEDAFLQVGAKPNIDYTIQDCFNIGMQLLSGYVLGQYNELIPNSKLKSYTFAYEKLIADKK